MQKLLPLLAMIGLVVIGCDQQPAAQATAGGNAIPTTLMLTSAPGEAPDLKVVKPNLRPGDEVVFRGVIGGREQPLAANRAIFTIIDPSIMTCDKMAEDHCKTPWDACCEDRDALVAGSASVQVVDAQGNPLRVGLNGHQGIAPAKEVVVVGKVRAADEKNLVIDATGIYVKS